MTSTGSSSSAPADERAGSRAELVIGLATYNSASLIDSAGDALRQALEGGFGDGTRIVLADGGSSDGTPDRLRAVLGSSQVVTVPFRVESSDLLAPYHGVPARLHATEQILRQARELGARVSVVIDLAACGTGTDWIQWLAQPVLSDNVDFVSGVHGRHAYAGALIKGIVYPVFRAVYGVRLRHPIADTFAVSERLLQHYLAEAEWPPDGPLPAIDVRLPAIAACDGFTIAEALLGVRLHEGRDGSPDLSAALSQAVGALFAELERRPDTWQRVRRSAPVPVCGTPPTHDLSAPAVNAERLADAFRLGSRELKDVWAMVLPPLSSIELKRLAATPLSRFRFEDPLWARIIYDYAIAHRLRILAREHLLPSLVPLYLGWLASFVLRTAGSSAEEAELQLERLCEIFEQEKPYLISRWRWPDRARIM
jgi:glucosylglycerate synthase